MPKWQFGKINSDYLNMKRLWVALPLFAAVGFIASAHALQPQPVPKPGSCPSGYNTSGNYCVPSANARYAVPKVGNCPSSYNTSGDYCLAGSSDAKLAIPKRGSCPSGYNTNGEYCVGGK